MPQLTRNGGRDSRSLLVNKEYKNNYARRLADLERLSEIATGGVRGGGDPSRGFPLAVPLIISANPSAVWDGAQWILGIVFQFAYTPPPLFMYLEAQIAGDDGYWNTLQISPYQASYTASGIGLTLGTTYSVRARAVVANRAPSGFSDWFTGIFLDPSPLAPDAPTNLRPNTTSSPPAGFGYNDNGAYFDLLYDPTVPAPHHYTLTYYETLNPITTRIHWPNVPGTWTGMRIEHLRRTVSYTFVMTAVNQYAGPDSTPLVITVPPEDPPSPTAVRFNTAGYNAPFGFNWNQRGGVAAITWTQPATPPDHYIFGYAPSGQQPSGWLVLSPASAWTGILVEGLVIGMAYDYYIRGVSRFEDFSSTPGMATLTVPAANPYPPLNFTILSYGIGGDGRGTVMFHWDTPLGRDAAHPGAFDSFYLQPIDGGRAAGGGTDQPIPVGYEIAGYARRFVVTGLDTGRIWRFWMCSINTYGGSGPQTATLSVSFVPHPPPNEPVPDFSRTDQAIDGTWAFTDWTDNAGAGVSSVAQELLDTYKGKAALRINLNAGIVTTVDRTLETGFLTVDPADSYTWYLAYKHGTGGAVGILEAQFYDSAATPNPVGSLIVVTLAAPSTSYQTVIFTVTPPAGARLLKLTVGASNVGALDSFYWSVLNCVVRVKADDITSGAVTTPALGLGAVTPPTMNLETDASGNLITIKAITDGAGLMDIWASSALVPGPGGINFVNFFGVNPNGSDSTVVKFVAPNGIGFIAGEDYGQTVRLQPGGGSASVPSRIYLIAPSGVPSGYLPSEIHLGAERVFLFSEAAGITPRGGGTLQNDYGELLLRMLGDGFGGSYMTLHNRGGENGIILGTEFSDTSIQLVDLILRYKTGASTTDQRNIRLEGRAPYVYSGGAPEYQFGNPGDPTLAVSDVGAIFRHGDLVASGAVNAVGGFQANGVAGITATVPLAKLTTGGANGSLTITNGIITARVNPT
jgi:hypothetical protein